MTFIDTVADLLILIDEPEHRERTMPKPDCDNKCLPSSNEFRLINEQIQMLVSSLATPTHNRHKPSCLERINRQGRFKETQKPFLFRLLPGNNDRQARRNLMNPKCLRNTDRNQDEQQIPGSRFFQTHRFEYFFKTCYHSFWIYPFRVSLFPKIPPYMFCEVSLQTVAVRRYFIINRLSFSHF